MQANSMPINNSKVDGGTVEWECWNGTKVDPI